VTRRRAPSPLGDVLAEALTGHLYPEELQARLRPFGIGEQAAVIIEAVKAEAARRTGKSGEAGQSSAA